MADTKETVGTRLERGEALSGPVLGYTVFRLTVGVNFLFHGFVRFSRFASTFKLSESTVTDR